MGERSGAEVSISQFEVNGIRLNVLVEGEGEPVVLLHGWPDSHLVWRKQVPALVAAGRRVIAPDLRGFGESDKPEGVEPYAIPHLLADLQALVDALGIEGFALVGHDWGAALAWAFASLIPGRVERLAAISVGHPSAFRDADFEQRRRSWYMLLFTHPIAEQVFPRDDWMLLRAFGACPDFERYVQDLSRPGALTASLGVYRANVPPEALFLGEPLQLPPVEVPVLGVWSSGDMALTESQMTRSAQYVAGPWRYERVEGCGHWIPIEAAERLNPMLVDFLSGSG
ncbi:MAG: putative hydrolase or acyltransferase of alpha/beta superfamily [Actinomycetia bacterium]|nr:putative hydrolase or acyltransferase of alpha/beta superfamily [Actinomycetes bacterium]